MIKNGRAPDTDGAKNRDGTRADHYTGNVTVGGPADTRELDGLRIVKIALGSGNNNAYLLRCGSTGQCLLIDAATDAPTLIRLLAAQTAGRLDQVITTHRHPDHWQALAAVVETTGATTLAGRLEAPEIPVRTDQLLDHGDLISVGSQQLEVIALRGHTPGSIALLYDDPGGRVHLFAGDSLFPGGVGRTWSPDDFRSLIDDVQQRIFDRLPDNTWIYPGHGADTTLGKERPHLPAWRARGW